MCRDSFENISFTLRSDNPWRDSMASMSPLPDQVYQSFAFYAASSGRSCNLAC